MESFVTGGTGFIGNTLTRRLVDAGDDVTVLVRSRGKANRVLGDLDVRVVVGDVTDVAGFAGELDGVDRVFHTAAYFREYYGPGEHWDRLRAVNVDGTRDMLAAADAAGVDAFVHVSSSGTIGREPDRSPGDESTPPAPVSWENAYFRSKLLADATIEGYLAGSDGRMRVVTVCPSIVVGPGDHSGTPGTELVREALTGDLPATFDGGSDFVDVRDVVDGMVRAAEQGAAGDRYVLSAEYVALPEFAERVAALGGREPPRLLPYPAIYLAAIAAEKWAEVTGSETLLTRPGVGFLRARLAVDATRAREELGVEFRPLSETLRDTAEWLVAEGYAPGVDLAPAETGTRISIRP
ncbi:NAD-dependent epimerase/dehydratase family protein [Salinirubellus salinus]|uniref:NAD-dependent epimerase/dehydratase family protein n=1 Tax=Salinirubellus salinus TaxID=1364945 RepID=A0A9E7R2V1_9EURY|nr:NAD-dependent epimerase/dehydratase family protein [Salinirubellus salinus]UWM54756.1 NAD-dependent epimerase/dehydratase family protein [Salinirubellus salinus]